MITWQSAANGPTPSPVTHVKRDPVVLIYQQSSLQKYQKHTVDVDIDNLSLFKVASNFNDVCRAGFCRNLNFVSVGASDIARLYSDSVAGFARGCTQRTTINNMNRRINDMYERDTGTVEHTAADTIESITNNEVENLMTGLFLVRGRSWSRMRTTFAVLCRNSKE